MRPPPLEVILLLIASITFYVWTYNGKRIRRWREDLRKQSRNL